MKIVLATGIYPPDIGGPATYVQNLARELQERGAEVVVVTYGKESRQNTDAWKVVWVDKAGGPYLRWRRYAQALRKVGSDADVVYAFSSVSSGLPLKMAKLKKPKKVLRLGGDFLWERYTDRGGRRPLREFYARYAILRHTMHWILRSFDHIVFSTGFQQHLYQRVYRRLPKTSIIENSVAPSQNQQHMRHDPLRLLFMGRFVQFKNLPALLSAVAGLPHVRLTLVGDGPVHKKAMALARKLSLLNRVTFLPPASGADKEAILREHDLLILPSLTEISPHMAVEARAAGLPVLLSEENGLREDLKAGMMLRDLRKSEDITRAVIEADQRYDEVSTNALLPYQERGWGEVAEETTNLFQSLTATQSV